MSPAVWFQDAKSVLAEVRELKFALEESNEAASHLQSELEAAQVFAMHLDTFSVYHCSFLHAVVAD